MLRYSSGAAWALAGPPGQHICGDGPVGHGGSGVDARPWVADAMRHDGSSVFGADEYIADKKREMAERNTKKFGCYVLDLNHRDVPLHEIKMLGLTIEEGVNIAVKAA